MHVRFVVLGCPEGAVVGEIVYVLCACRVAMCRLCGFWWGAVSVGKDIMVVWMGYSDMCRLVG